MTTLQKSPDYWIDQGIKKLASQCHSSPSTIIRLAKKLNFSGFTELAYFIKFNINTYRNKTLPPIQQNWFEYYPENGYELFKQRLKQGTTVIHGNGFSQLVAQYLYNRFLTVGINSKLSIWSDFDMIHQVANTEISMVVIISKSGSSSWAMEWASAVHNKNIAIACITGDKESPIAQLADIVFVVQDSDKFDSEMSQPNLFFGCCLIGIEKIIETII